MGEIWKDIEGFEGRYQISNMGRVKTLPSKRYGLEPRIKKVRLSNWGYYRAQFRIAMTGQCKNYSIHRLVAQAFIHNPENKPEVNHINGVKTDNRAENLEWATPQENMAHAWRTGLKSGKPNTWTQKGGHHSTAKRILAFNRAGDFIREYDCVRGAERDLGVATGQVCKVLKGVKKTVRGLTFKYASA